MTNKYSVIILLSFLCLILINYRRIRLPISFGHINLQEDQIDGLVSVMQAYKATYSSKKQPLNQRTNTRGI